MKLLDEIKIELTGDTVDPLTVYIDIFDNSLSRKWLVAFNNLIQHNYHLEKNYCFHGFVDHTRNGPYILDQVNKSINAINQANLGYTIDDYFSMDNSISDDPSVGWGKVRNLNHDKLNQLHRYFEDLQGTSGNMAEYYNRADYVTKWHIRQLNNLCHEFESWALSYRKEVEAPEWRRPSQLMCWLHAPRFTLDEEDYELFGIETIGRPMGGVFVGVNKAIGKHHWEVFNDEGRDSRIDELTTTSLRSQTVAAGDFDVEWGVQTSLYEWQQRKFKEFREWLIANNFDPADKSLTIGHPQIGQVNLKKTFGTTVTDEIWKQLTARLNVRSITTGTHTATYNYSWADADYKERQIASLWP
tara:strand:+ start:4967 stop:6037 length:1071 start_codon:yes stop_codon:yes gene_type:complete